MFGSDLLEVVIGIVFIYILVSIICSAVREGVETFLKTRSAYLEHGIRELLHDSSGTGLATSLYRHPLIQGLYLANYEPQERPRGSVRWLLHKGTGLPSYIPAKNFAVALMDLAARGPATDAFSSSAGSTPISVESIRQNVARLGNPGVQRALLTAIDTADGDLKKLQRNLEDWYDSGMDRVSGWYKRSTQWIVFWIGMLVAVVFNVNTITIADYLYRDDAARQVLVARAEAAAKDSGFIAMVNRQRPASAAPAAPPAAAPADTADTTAAGAAPADTATADTTAAGTAASDTGVTDTSAKGRAARARADSLRLSDYARARAALDSLSLPIGWSNLKLAPAGEKVDGWDVLKFILLSLLGWAATGLAATMGAPFWFDVLNKVMVIRSTVKPKEKSPEEGSEDRQAKKGEPDVTVDVQQAAPPHEGSPPGAPPPLDLNVPDPDDAEADVDACDVEFEDETPDEALPMAEGGVG